MNPLFPRSRTASLTGVIIFAVAWLTIMYLIMINNIHGIPATEQQVLQVMESRGFTPLDLTMEYREVNPDMGLEKNIAANDAGLRFDFFVFDYYDNAEKYFNAVCSNIKNNYSQKNKVNHVISGNYSAFVLAANGEYNAVFRIGNTVILTQCDEENSQQVVSMLGELDYYFDTTKNPPKAQTQEKDRAFPNPKGAIAAIIFAAMIPLSKTMLRVLWSLVCAAAYTTPEEVLGMYINSGSGKRRSTALYSWLLKKSRNSLRFRVLFFLYQVCTISGIVFFNIALLGCFIKYFDKFLGYAMVIQPAFILAVGVASILYDKYRGKQV